MMEEIFELTNSVATTIIDGISDDDAIKSVLELGSDILDASIPGVQLIAKSYNKIRVLKFKSFLKGIAKSTEKFQRDGVELKRKLTRLSEKKIYGEYIVSVYESAIDAKSVRNTAVLGYFLAKNTFLENDITIEQRTISQALSDLTDFESNVFLSIYSKAEVVQEYRFLDARKLTEEDHDVYSIQLVIEVLKNNRIVGRGIGGFELSEQFGVCLFTMTTDSFYNLLREFDGADEHRTMIST